MISLLITVMIFSLVAYVVFWGMGYLGVPEPIRKVITVVIVLIAVIWILSLLPGLTGYHPPWGTR